MNKLIHIALICASIIVLSGGAMIIEPIVLYVGLVSLMTTCYSYRVNVIEKSNQEIKKS